MFRKYENDAKDAVDEMMSRVAGLTLEDWEEFQKEGIQF